MQVVAIDGVEVDKAVDERLGKSLTVATRPQGTGPSGCYPPAAMICGGGGDSIRRRSREVLIEEQHDIARNAQQINRCSKSITWARTRASGTAESTIPSDP